MKLKGWFEYLKGMYRKTYYLEFTEMLSRLGDAKILTFDLDSIEVTVYLAILLFTFLI